MGVSILASWRHPNVVVMAPALTEAGQTQSYKNNTFKKLCDSVELSPDLKRNPVDIIGLSPGRVLKASNGLCVNVKEKLGLVSPIHKTNGCNGHSLEVTQHNRSYLMGDQPDAMGLHKSSPLDVKSTQENGNNFIKDKNDMDQLLKNLGAAISGSGLAPSDFPPPNVDELLQVIKSMENNCDTTDPASDQNDTEAIFPLSSQDLSSFERDLLNDVEFNFVDLPETSLDLKQTYTKENLEEVFKKSFETERTLERMKRRLKKLQARCVGKSASEEVTGLLEHSLRLSRNNGDLRTTILKDKKLKGASDSTISSLMRRLSASAHHQAGITKSRSLSKYFGSGSCDIEPPPGSILPKLTGNESEEVQEVSAKLLAHIHLTQKQLDSDATASSSGGESCDETHNYSSSHQSELPLSKRALWRWCLDRGVVASRWAWLQAQIADLEYKMRVHTEYQKQARAQKGKVLLKGDIPTPPPQVSVNGYHGTLPGSVCYKPTADDPTETCCRTRPLLTSAFKKRKIIHSLNLHKISKKAARPSTVWCNCDTSRTSCALCTGRLDPTNPAERLESQSVRERIALHDHCYHAVLSFPSEVQQSVHLDSIMQLHGWQLRATHHASAKTNKMSTSVDYKSRLDRRPKLKSKLHSTHKAFSKIRKHTTAALSAKLKRKLTAHQRKRRDLKVREQQQRVPRLRIRSKPRKVSIGFDPISEEDSELYCESVPVDRSSPLLETRSEDNKSDKDYVTTRGRGRIRGTTTTSSNGDMDSFSIDNIVIPYSLASINRIYKLPCKEIPTPGWRPSLSDFSDVRYLKNIEKPVAEMDEITDAALTERHNQCEQLEKAKFMRFNKKKLPLGSGVFRSRGSRRSDSRAESSGANTPDPMSPCPDMSEVSPVTTPPATPQSVTEEQCQQINTRRRTVSSSAIKTQLREKVNSVEERCTTPDENSCYVEITPFERRQYPLTEELEDMLKDMPEGHTLLSTYYKPHYKFNMDRDSEYDDCLNNPLSPGTSSTVSALEEHDDPNDPEWSMLDDRDEQFDVRNRR